MNKAIVATMLAALACAAFAQEAAVPSTVEEAVSMITPQCARLKLSASDEAAAIEAFMAMIEAGLSYQEAYRLVSEGLEQGLRARDMTRLAEQARLRTRTRVETAARVEEGSTYRLEEHRSSGEPGGGEDAAGSKK